MSREEIIKKMYYCENNSEFVFKQGDQASTYFIIGNNSLTNHFLGFLLLLTD